MCEVEFISERYDIFQIQLEFGMDLQKWGFLDQIKKYWTEA
jgi:hypothetical protein